jgi:hypothetical protein
MKANYLIFPMVLNDYDFQTITNCLSLINSLNFSAIDSLSSHFHNIIYSIAKASIDLSEMLTNKNCKGYRYNSYILNMAILKLTFASEIIENKYSNTLFVELKTIDSCINQLHSVLSTAYELQELADI